MPLYTIRKPIRLTGRSLFILTQKRNRTEPPKLSSILSQPEVHESWQSLKEEDRNKWNRIAYVVRHMPIYKMFSGFEKVVKKNQIGVDARNLILSERNKILQHILQEAEYLSTHPPPDPLPSDVSIPDPTVSTIQEAAEEEGEIHQPDSDALTQPPTQTEFEDFFCFRFRFR